MTQVAEATDYACQRIPAVIHSDMTSRVQLVSHSSNPILHSLLLEYEKTSGDPVSNEYFQF